MSFYRQGLSVAQPAPFSNYRGGVAVGALVATPGVIKDEAKRLNVEVETLASEIAASRAIGQPDPTSEQEEWFNNVWAPFYRGWAVWYEDHGATWGARNWYENFWGSAWDEAQKWRQKLIDIRKSIPKSIPIRSPMPAPPEQGWGAKAMGELWDMVKTLVWAAVIIGGAIVLFRYIG